MPFMSRSSKQRILILVIRTCLQVGMTHPVVAHAPAAGSPEAPVLHPVSRNSESSAPRLAALASLPLRGYAASACARKRRRILRKRLRAASMALGLARLQLRIGLTQEAEAALAKIHEDVQQLRSCLIRPEAHASRLAPHAPEARPR